MSNRDMPVEPDADASVSDLEADLQLTREQLGDTIDAISTKLDVKTQMKDTVSHARANVADSTAQAKQAVVERPVPVLAIIGVTALVIVLWRRNR